MIVKVQKPINPPPPVGQALVYSEKRDVMCLVDWRQVRGFMGSDLKQYRHATYNEATGKITFGEQAPTQNW